MNDSFWCVNTAQNPTMKSTPRALLVVDDAEPLRRLISVWAAGHGFDVSCASNGKQAIDLLNTRHFDLILTDFHMPAMNGWELLRWMRKHRSAIPVCMMTSDAGDQAFWAEIKPYVDGLLAKPFSFQELARCIETMERGGTRALPN